jgi:hypothetical protein
VLALSTSRKVPERLAAVDLVAGLASVGVEAASAVLDALAKDRSTKVRDRVRRRSIARRGLRSGPTFDAEE